MDTFSNKDGVCPQLLDLIPKERKWPLQSDEERRHGPSDESNKLDLRLGPPGEQDWTVKDGTEKNSRYRDQYFLSLGCFSNTRTSEDCWIMSDHNGSQTKSLSSLENRPVVGETMFSSPWSSTGFQLNIQQQQQQQQQAGRASFLQLQSVPQSVPAAVAAAAMESPQQTQPCCTKVVDLQTAKNKAFSPASANTAVPNSSQKRSAPAPVVGWPPIRSSRKNFASTSSLKQPLESSNGVSTKVATEKPKESCQKGLFVKINMDGVPIGRKVDLKAYDSYEKLSSAVDELFRGLLAVQRDSSAGGLQNNQKGEKAITGLLDGSGEYTLVYEDNEGDRMLVGDVPWHMFASTVKRLRVLRSSEVPTLCFGNKQEKLTHLVLPRNE